MLDNIFNLFSFGLERWEVTLLLTIITIFLGTDRWWRAWKARSQAIYKEIEKIRTAIDEQTNMGDIHECLYNIEQGIEGTNGALEEISEILSLINYKLSGEKNS